MPVGVSRGDVDGLPALGSAPGLPITLVSPATTSMRLQLTITLAIGACLASVAVVGGKKLGQLDRMLRQS